MRVGVIGLGNIAQKAYLPVISAKENVEPVFCTRNINTLNKLSAKYRITDRVSTVEELINTGIDAAFVHSSTESHGEIVEKLLLNKINVYVDKPISYSYSDALKLAELSEKTGRILMVGFNRRFAPMYKSLKDQGTANMIIMQKNRLYNPDNARVFIFDDFVHVVDTLRFLAPGNVGDIQTRFLKKDGLLYNVVLQLSGNDYTAIGIMNRDSGITEETVEYMCPGSKQVIQDMVLKTSYINGIQQITKFNDWDPVLYRRGFYQIVDHFLYCVEHNTTPSPSIQDSLITHEICERIINDISNI